MGRPTRDPNQSQVCTRCKLKLPPSAFGRRGRTNNALRSRCKDCEQLITKEWQHKNRKRYRQLQQRYIDKMKSKSS